MTQLTITSTPSMGPLEVSVYPPDGDPIEFTLSSGLTTKSLPAESGRYTVVARRPNGSRLRQTTDVGGEDASVSLSDAVGATPNEFMQPEVERGEIAPALETSARIGLGAPLSGVFADILGRAMLDTTASRVLRSGDPVAPSLPTAATVAEPEPLHLQGWRLSGPRWLALDNAGLPVEQIASSSDFVKLALHPWTDAEGAPGEVLCFGLLNKAGFGPLVILAPFVAPVDLTFVVEGVRAQAADRSMTPGQQRVPVALFTPSAQAIADLLSALAAPATLSAETIWNQAAPELAPDSERDVGHALSVLVEKFRRPAEALVAAHYVLRFLPKKLPLAWAENLVNVMPLAADGPVIAAWAWIHNRPQNATDEQVDEAVARNVSLALARPVTLFARTRTLLFEAQHLVSADPNSNPLWRRDETFRRAGAAAGGLESFWGWAPDSPGSTGKPARDALTP